MKCLAEDAASTEDDQTGGDGLEADSPTADSPTADSPDADSSAGVAINQDNSGGP